ncbi:hypothetical protein AMTRI_Chr03g54750 [Amborella trichopoda]
MFKNLDWWFDSYLWVTDGGNIEARYTSRAAELYQQLLSKEVADKHEASEVTASPKVPSHPVTSTIKMPIGARKGSKTGGIGAQKLTTKVELTGSSTNASATPSIGSLFPSRFEYVVSMPSSVPNFGGTQLLNHVSPLKSSSLYAVLELTVESRKWQVPLTPKFSSTSISIADLFGHNTDDPSTSSLAKLIPIDTILVIKLEIFRKLMIHSSHSIIFYFFSLFFDSFGEH